MARRKELTPFDIEALKAAAIKLFHFGFASADQFKDPHVIVIGPHGKIVYRVEVYWTIADWESGDAPAVTLTGRR